MNEAAREYRKLVVAHVLTGPGKATPAARQAAFDNRGVDPRASALVGKVARQAWTVTDQDVAATKAAGVTEDEIFELAVAAALGQASRQFEAAMAALDAATAPNAMPAARDGDSR